MSELTKLVVVSVKDSEISTQLQVAELDYSAVYDAVAYKQQFDKDTKEWEDSEEAMEKYNEALKVVGGAFEEDSEIELWVDKKAGKAYFKEGTGFLKIEKPLVSMKKIKLAPIVAIKDSPKGRAVVIEHEGVNYAFNFNTGVWIAKKKIFVPNPAKLEKAKVNFGEIFEDVGINWDNAEKAIGMLVTCTVKKNALDKTNPLGWLEADPLDPDDQPEQKPEPKDEPQDLDNGDDDLPF